MISLSSVNGSQSPVNMSSNRRVGIQSDMDDDNDSSLLDSSDSVNLLGRSEPTLTPPDRLVAESLGASYSSFIIILIAAHSILDSGWCI